MSLLRSVQSTQRILVIALTAAILGCSSEPTKPAPVVLPANDTPQNTILRFVATYKGKMEAEYESLFTGDFTYEFSSTTDPTLVAKWSTGWFAVDESLSAKHLFHGGVNLDGQLQLAATSIDLILTPTGPIDDPDRDPGTHKFLEADVSGQVVIPPTPPATDPTTYVFAGNRNRFYLVRGDSAQGLGPSQPAGSNHWYIWAWKDVSTSVAPEAPTLTPQPARTSTWARVKAVYR